MADFISQLKTSVPDITEEQAVELGKSCVSKRDLLLAIKGHGLDRFRELGKQYPNAKQATDVPPSVQEEVAQHNQSTRQWMEELNVGLSPEQMGKMSIDEQMNYLSSNALIDGSPKTWAEIFESGITRSDGAHITGEAFLRGALEGNALEKNSEAIKYGYEGRQKCEAVVSSLDPETLSHLRAMSETNRTQTASNVVIDARLKSQQQIT